MKITKIEIENFCGIKKLETQMYDRTLISGANEVGKSTIRNAVCWVLYNKMADGQEASDIRPHDKDGKDIDMVDISVSVTIEHEGTEYELKKVQSQKWIKKRGTDDKKFQGNENSYFISDIPKAEKDYKAFIESIVDLDTLLYGTNAHSFLSLDAKKRREKLLSLETELSDEEVAGTDEELKGILPLLKIGTVDELITRSKKAIKEYKEEQKSIPIRVDEISNTLTDISMAELEPTKTKLDEKITEVNNSIAEEEKRLEKANTDYMDCEFSISERKREINEELNRDYRDSMNEYDAMKLELYALEKTLEQEERIKETNKGRIEHIQKNIEETKAEIEDLKSKKFEPKSEKIKTTCPTCMQELPKEQIDEIKARIKAENEADKETFEQTQKNTIQARLDILKAYNDELNDCVIDEDKEKEIKGKIADMKSRIAEFKVASEKEPDYDNDEKIKELQAKKEQALAITEDKTRLNELKAELDELATQEAELNKQIVNAKHNEDIQARVKELKARQLEVSQKIADEEKQLDTLDRFNRKRMEMVTEKINSRFDIVKFRLFKEQINGGYALVCDPIVNGSDYYKTLNHGNRLLAEIDICKAFQKEQKLPILVDDTESIDEWRIPELDRQLICLRRTDDKELKITE